MRALVFVPFVVSIASLASVSSISSAQPPTSTVVVERKVVPSRTSRVVADTLYWILPRPVPLPKPFKGTTDSLKLVFGRDSIYQLVGAQRFALPPVLWPLAANMRAVVTDTVATP